MESFDVKRHHCIISGTGRAGTSFLIQLLTHLGLDTGYTSDNLLLDSIARAGCEQNIFEETAPYFVKSPKLCKNIKKVLKQSNIIIDSAIIPVRDLKAAVKSRIFVQEENYAQEENSDFDQPVSGGLWLTNNPNEQLNILAIQFYNLVQWLVRFDVPILFMDYPRLIKDSMYTYQKLGSLLNEISFKEFSTTFDSIVREDWINSFSENDRYDSEKVME